mmetsp:Transcript_23180/g.51738  ORF Transcript_23180/g.51738 Transcript_23180/m.51738 type:complete len:218 (-) Transcript_23180:94-747(-)
MPSPTVTTTRSVRVTDSWPVAQPPTTPNVDPFFACSLIVKIAAVSPLPAFPWVRLPSQPIPPLLGAVVNSAGASPSSPSPLSSSTYWTSDTAASPGRKNLTTYSSFGSKLPAAPSSGETSIRISGSGLLECGRTALFMIISFSARSVMQEILLSTNHDANASATGSAIVHSNISSRHATFAWTGWFVPGGIVRRRVGRYFMVLSTMSKTPHRWTGDA